MKRKLYKSNRKNNMRGRDRNQLAQNQSQYHLRNSLYR